MEEISYDNLTMEEIETELSNTQSKIEGYKSLNKKNERDYINA